MNAASGDALRFEVFHDIVYHRFGAAHEILVCAEWIRKFLFHHIDARPFAGGLVAYPSPEVWDLDLVSPLKKATDWLRAIGHSMVTLSGRYRLSTGFAVGAAFRATFGFDLAIPTRDGFWNTNSHREPNTNYPEWTIERATQLLEDRLIVSVGVLRDPTSHVAKQFEIDSANQILCIILPQALTSGEDAQASVQAIKGAVGCQNLLSSVILSRLAPARRWFMNGFRMVWGPWWPRYPGHSGPRLYLGF